MIPMKKTLVICMVVLLVFSLSFVVLAKPSLDKKAKKHFTIVEKGESVKFVMENFEGFNLNLLHKGQRGISGAWAISFESQDGSVIYCSDNSIAHSSKRTWSYWDFSSCTDWTEEMLNDFSVSLTNGDAGSPQDAYIYKLSITE